MCYEYYAYSWKDGLMNGWVNGSMDEFMQARIRRCSYIIFCFLTMELYTYQVLSQKLDVFKFIHISCTDENPV